MITRRKLLLGLPPAFALASPAFAAFQHLSRLRPKKKQPPTQAPSLVYFGTDTSRGVARGIYVARFEHTTGHLTPPVLVASTVRPSFMALGPARTGRRILYSVAAGADTETSVINSFVIDPVAGSLTPLNRVSAGGIGPCYISVDSTGQSAFAANYTNGTVSTYKILPDGKLDGPAETIDLHDTARFGAHGPNASRQTGPHAHSTLISPDDRFLIVNDLGDDSIDIFPIDAGNAHLGMMQPHRFSNNRPGSGPRHCIFHPNGRWVYNIDELDSTVDRFLWTTTHKQGESQAILVDTLKTTHLIAPETSAARNTAAEIAISPDGFFLYASNRGEDTLVVFAIDQSTGDLKFVQRVSSGGKAPRHFTFSPNANWIVCGNQDSANVAVFKRDPATGKLTGPVQTVPLDSPMFSIFV